MKREGCC